MPCRYHRSRGRGVLIVHVDHVQQTLRGEYNTMESDDGTTASRAIRALVNSYNPARQAVLSYRDEARGLEAARIIDIDAQH